MYHTVVILQYMCKFNSKNLQFAFNGVLLWNHDPSYSSMNVNSVYSVLWSTAWTTGTKLWWVWQIQSASCIYMINYYVILDYEEKIGHCSSLQKLWSRWSFTSSSLDIGISFQLAITTPRLDLIGYGTATAQSWPCTSQPGLIKTNMAHSTCGLHNGMRWFA